MQGRTIGWPVAAGERKSFDGRWLDSEERRVAPLLRLFNHFVLG